MIAGDWWTPANAPQRHCVMLENCCYGENELFVLNLARQGVFGNLTHAECAYLHDLRTVLFSLGTEGDWRRNYHWQYNGNLYPTHGLGPVAEYLGVGRGDQFKFLVSMSSQEMSLTHYRDEDQPERRTSCRRKIHLRRHEHVAHQDRIGPHHHAAARRRQPAPVQPHQRPVRHWRACFLTIPARLSVDHPKAIRPGCRRFRGLAVG